MTINVNEIKYPTTPQEVEANRRKVIKGLRRYKNQCFGDLYYDRHGKHQMCAVGVCGAVLFGIKTRDDYFRVIQDSGRAFNIYEAVARMLDMRYQETSASGKGDVDDIWRMNDSQSLSFKQIAEQLAGKWDLA